MLLEDTQAYVRRFRTTYDMQSLLAVCEAFKDLKVLVIGDTIIDHYVFTKPKGRAIKDPILSVEYSYDEKYAGGILAIANHLSDFVKKVKVITLVGERDPQLEFIRGSVQANVELRPLVKENSPTIVKRRYIDYQRNHKLFKVEFMNDEPISPRLTAEALNLLDEELSAHDLVVVGDFGHGFINSQIKQKVEEKGRFLSANVQSNSANMGYNYFTTYRRLDFLSMDEEELRLPLNMRFEPLDDVIRKAYEQFGFEQFLITRGKQGLVFVRKGKLYKAPILTSQVKDTVGAGDALFAITSLLAYQGIDTELVPFLANCVGGLAVNVMGNKESVTKEKVAQFIKGVYNGVGAV